MNENKNHKTQFEPFMKNGEHDFESTAPEGSQEEVKEPSHVAEPQREAHTDDQKNHKQVNLENEYNKLKSDLLYLGAEFENYKKHSIKERSDLIKYGGERFIRDLLDIIDNFERALALEVREDNWKTFFEGVQLIHRELKSLLPKHGVLELNPLGQVFDPGTHEALTSEETDKVQPGGVSQVFKKAYKLHDRLLRPAQVVVARAPSAKPEKTVEE